MRSLLKSTTALLTCVSALTVIAAQQRPEPKYMQRLEFPTREERFEPPQSVTADLHTGEVFVTDTRGTRVVIYDRLGTYRYQIPSGIVYRAPIDVAVDPEGFLFVLAKSGTTPIVARLDFDGLYLGEISLPTVAGSEEGPDPVSLAISPTGDRLYVMDQASGGRLWILDREGGVRREIDVVDDDSWEPLRGRLLGRTDVYGDTLLVSLPVEGRIRICDLNGDVRGHVGRKGAGPCQLGLPIAAAMDRNGKVFIVDRQRMVLQLWDPEANRCLGEYSGIGQSAGALYNPLDMALDGNGRLFISQGYEGRVQVFEVAIPAPSPGASVPQAQGGHRGKPAAGSRSIMSR